MSDQELPDEVNNIMDKVQDDIMKSIDSASGDKQKEESTISDRDIIQQVASWATKDAPIEDVAREAINTMLKDRMTRIKTFASVVAQNYITMVANLTNVLQDIDRRLFTTENLDQASNSELLMMRRQVNQTLSNLNEFILKIPTETQGQTTLIDNRSVNIVSNDILKAHPQNRAKVVNLVDRIAKRMVNEESE